MTKSMNKQKSAQGYVTQPIKVAQEPTPQQPKPVQAAVSQQAKPAQAAASRQTHAIPCASPVTNRVVTHDAIGRRAYEIYIEKGCPQGQSEPIWLQAEKELQALIQAKQKSK